MVIAVMTQKTAGIIPYSTRIIRIALPGCAVAAPCVEDTKPAAARRSPERPVATAAPTLPANPFTADNVPSIL